MAEWRLPFILGLRSALVAAVAEFQVWAEQLSRALQQVLQQLRCNMLAQPRRLHLPLAQPPPLLQRVQQQDREAEADPAAVEAGAGRVLAAEVAGEGEAPL